MNRFCRDFSALKTDVKPKYKTVRRDAYAVDRGAVKLLRKCYGFTTTLRPSHEIERMSNRLLLNLAEPWRGDLEAPLSDEEKKQRILGQNLEKFTTTEEHWRDVTQGEGDVKNFRYFVDAVSTGNGPTILVAHEVDHVHYDGARSVDTKTFCAPGFNVKRPAVEQLKAGHILQWVLRAAPLDVTLCVGFHAAGQLKKAAFIHPDTIMDNDEKIRRNYNAARAKADDFFRQLKDLVPGEPFFKVTLRSGCQTATPLHVPRKMPTGKGSDAPALPRRLTPEANPQPEDTPRSTIETSAKHRDAYSVTAGDVQLLDNISSTTLLDIEELENLPKQKRNLYDGWENCEATDVMEWLGALHRLKYVSKKLEEQSLEAVFGAAKFFAGAGHICEVLRSLQYVETLDKSLGGAASRRQYATVVIIVRVGDRFLLNLADLASSSPLSDKAKKGLTLGKNFEIATSKKSNASQKKEGKRKLEYWVTEAWVGVEDRLPVTVVHEVDHVDYDGKTSVNAKTVVKESVTALNQVKNNIRFRWALRASLVGGKCLVGLCSETEDEQDDTKGSASSPSNEAIRIPQAQLRKVMFCTPAELLKTCRGWYNVAHTNGAHFFRKLEEIMVGRDFVKVTINGNEWTAEELECLREVGEALTNVPKAQVEDERLLGEIRPKCLGLAQVKGNQVDLPTTWSIHASPTEMAEATRIQAATSHGETSPTKRSNQQ
ncbi:unnamed protein product, partial [Mesorhabditis spiculigera]